MRSEASKQHKIAAGGGDADENRHPEGSNNSLITRSKSYPAEMSNLDKPTKDTNKNK